MKNKFWTTLLISSLVLALIGCTSKSADTTATTTGTATTTTAPKSGGTIKFAYNVQPTTLDPQITTAIATRDIARNMFETLVTLDSKYKVVPMLAESFETSADGKTITFKLRKGVKFHNGKEMKAEDVVASMLRWQQGPVAKANFGSSTWEATDEYTVVLHPEKPSFLNMIDLASTDQFAAIMPKETIAAADATGVKEYIGTGPFQFVEWKQNQYVHFKKFADYSAVSSPADGLAGKKVALVDDLYFNIVTDSSTRVNGIIAGEYDLANAVPYDAAAQVKNAPGISTIVYPMGIHIIVFNKQQGLFKDVKARQAVNLALNEKELLTAAFSSSEFYDYGNSFFPPTQTNWYTDTGKENYDHPDLEKAKQLLKEAGYNGEPITIITNRDYIEHYNTAVNLQQQLSKIGMNIKLEVMDFTTQLDRRNKPDQYNMFVSGQGTFISPFQFPFLDSKSKWAGWTNNPEIDKLLAEIKSQPTQEKATESFVKLQKLVWEDLPVINTGTYKQIKAVSKKVKGFQEFIGPVLWNTSIEN
jgi:peptide/nickel transport system substrate-binding protein